MSFSVQTNHLLLILRYGHLSWVNPCFKQALLALFLPQNQALSFTLRLHLYDRGILIHIKVPVMLIEFSITKNYRNLKGSRFFIYYFPFLEGLLRKEHYHIWSLYTGLPSSTPSVQGELFYGQPMVVPAFSYYDPQEDRVMVMYDGNDAQEIEARLKKSQETDNSLLKEGTSGI